jgi:DNA (cytosine-5)-methyltransferase 1
MFFHNEIIVDNFAGGGGASTGIEQALGRSVDIAINHDPEAVAMHAANHPTAKHYIENVWDVDPVEACQGRPVGLAWFSPDCKHFSKAKGGQPKSQKIRGLAWVAIRWAATVKPRVIVLENVEEFLTWGPIVNGKPCAKNKGRTFRTFVNALARHGYQVDWKMLRACDFGAPTTRRRFFLIARCDGRPIAWPVPTHGAPHTAEVLSGQRLPWRTAAECIDWSIACPSIFDRKRPLADATMRRIARGIQKYVIDAKEPFIVTCNHGHNVDFRGHGLSEPFRTITAARDAHGVVVPTLIQRGYGEAPGQAPRVPGLEKPLGTIVAQGEKHALITANLIRQFGTSNGAAVTEPMKTIVASGAGAKTGLVYSFLQRYNGQGIGQSLDAPMLAVTSKDRMSLVTIDAINYVIADIGMRMLQPHELYRAQGFPADYILAPVVNGKSLSKTAQVRMCGNSVCPPVSAAIVAANFGVARRDVA